MSSPISMPLSLYARIKFPGTPRGGTVQIKKLTWISREEGNEALGNADKWLKKV